MLRNNNQAVVKRISRRSLKKNRIRNLFTILAIILTTFMFTTVFSIGFSVGKNMNVMMPRQQGTRSTVYLPNPSVEQIKQVRACKSLNAAGIQINAGKAQGPEEDGEVISLACYDRTEFEQNYIPAVSDIEGVYPESEDEIMLSRAALGALNIKNPKCGMNISLQLEGKEKTFKLSGFFKDYTVTEGSFQGFVSKKYCEEAGLTVKDNGRLSISAEKAGQSELVDELEHSVKLREGQKFDVSYDVTEENDSNLLMIAIIAGFVGGIIILSGYLLIYNVMYISVTKDIRFYGMLKTIGMTPGQIRRVVKSQAFLLSLIGIPAGILLGTVVSFAAVPYSMQVFGSGMNDAMPADISFNPFIYIGTILFGIITIAVSCRKPAKLAARISPVEALKFNGQNNTGIKAHRSTGGGRLYKMAFRNVFREKKRAILVFLSLFMGTAAFLATNAFISSLKPDNYMDYYVPDDYTIYGGAGEPDVKKTDQKEKSEAMEKLAHKISGIEGVEEVHVNRFLNVQLAFDETVFRPFLDMDVERSGEENVQELIDGYNKNGDFTCSVMGVDSAMIEKYNKKAYQKIDVERFERGELCLVGWLDSREQADKVKGKKITMTDPETQNSICVEIGACTLGNEQRGININYYFQSTGTPGYILVSQKLLEKLNEHPVSDMVIADCEAERESYVTARIKELIRSNPAVVHADIKTEVLGDFKAATLSMNILTAGISIILILIGVINFINVMLTGVFTRRKELAVLESVGMTKKQIQKMLMLEGGYYGVITVFLIASAGNLIIYLVAKLAEKAANYAVFDYPWRLMGGIIIMIILICVLVPAAVYKMLSKESVTERLRNTE